MQARNDTAPGLRITEATLADARLIFELTLAAWEEYRGRLEPPSGVFGETVADVEAAIAHGGAVVAYLDGEAAGCCRYVAPEGTGYLYFGTLAVVPRFRRGGIASALVRWLEQRAAERGLPEVRLGVRLALPGNIALYTGLGYEIFDYDERPGFGRVTATMRKRLPPARPA
jgi:ribosomal protein S18 acetylase RimI-like enzyme